ncbi:VanW family protein [Syntrophomonas erecta subsp. sporosyntropha]
MKKSLLLPSMVLLVLITIVLADWVIHSNQPNRNASKPLQVQDYGSPRITESEQYSYLFKNQKMKSGPVNQVPWENNPEFKQMQLQTGAFVKMAAYRTVLNDPLPGEEYNVHLTGRLISGTIVAPGEIFSQNKTAGPYTEARGFKKGPTYMGTWLTTTTGGGVCKMASTLYNVAVLANLPIVERHYHSMPVPYVPYGQDATVSYGVKDFRFRNDTPDPLLIWAQGVGNSLYVAFYGQASSPQVEWHHKVLNVTPTYRIYRDNQTLPQGEQKVVVEGMDGATLQSWISINNPPGKAITRKLDSSYYSPMPYIIEKGCASPALSNSP